LLSTSILHNKPDTLAAARAHHNTQVSLYCDGSGFEDGIGASAVLYINKIEQKSLRYFLGPSTEHTVYEGELVGLSLALHLLNSLSFQLHSHTVIGTDNQAAIRALNNQRSHPAHYLLDHIHKLAESFQSKQYDMHRPTSPPDDPRCPANLQIHWTPGHERFIPNERADALAKQAAQGSSSPKKKLPHFLRNKPLPLSISAIRQANLANIRHSWKTRWKRSPRFPLINSLDKTLPSNGYLKLVSSLNRQQSAILTQLRTGHSPLNLHLFRIHRSETPSCPHCQGITVETVKHYLLQCPHYQHKRHILRRKLKRSADSLPFLLSNRAAIKPLIIYIRSTKRFANLT
jgi:ribonuclease HI